MDFFFFDEKETKNQDCMNFLTLKKHSKHKQNNRYQDTNDQQQN